MQVTKHKKYKYIYNLRGLLEKCDCVDIIEESAERLHNKLIRADINKLIISDYTKMFLGKNLANIHGLLKICTYQFVLALQGNSKPINDQTMIDYGGGWGLISLLAKEIGFKNVIYNDIYDISCSDAQTIAKELACEANHYVEGDIEDLKDFINSHGIDCDLLISNDVIEHIYDVENFIKKMSELSDGFFNAVMASDANGYNPLRRRYLMKRQNQKEYKSREKSWGHKERDSLEAFCNIREKIIRTAAPSLSSNIVHELTMATRGMNEYDIIKSTNEYLDFGKMPKLPGHPTNTCDPRTGNWEEHLMTKSFLERSFTSVGFEFKFVNGYYGAVSSNILKKYLGAVLNFLIVFFRSWGIVFSPYYVICVKIDKS
jgi:2-polyprenyl-3-methyl-5-hydroxy-6-metoxy-1,4-benzoquinol methylase